MSAVSLLTLTLSCLTRVKPSDFDYLKVIGKGSFGKVCGLTLVLFMVAFVCVCAVKSGGFLVDDIHSLFQVLLARHRNSKDYYAVKVLQKQAILRKREVRINLSV